MEKLSLNDSNNTFQNSEPSKSNQPLFTNNTKKAVKEKNTTHNVWAKLSIKYKLFITIFLIFAVACGTIYMTYMQSQDTIHQSFAQGNEYYNINNFQSSLVDCEIILKNFLRYPSEGASYIESWKEIEQQMQAQLAKLNVNVQEIGQERYLLSNAIIHGFEQYTLRCEKMFAQYARGASVVQLYEMFADINTANQYLHQYTRNLQTLALSDGQAVLAELRLRNEEMRNVNILIFIFAILLVAALFVTLVRSIVAPVLHLAQESKAIGAGDFQTPDLQIENRDELYTLTKAFNHMKHSMRRLVATLEERNAIALELHQKELEASENTRLLEQTKMLQLRSQINPHFLFNTLNIISRTARKEKAPASERLILSLARLFRYNLKTDDTYVALQREINIVNDYVNIQSTRFENRIALRWKIAPDIDPEKLLVPAFIFQPIIENAIIHGLEPKVNGGVIRVHIYKRNDDLYVRITDNGVGMDKETLQSTIAKQTVRGDVSGIGVGNVKSRIQMLNPNARFAMVSHAGMGTSVRMVLPNVEEGEYTNGFILQ